MKAALLNLLRGHPPLTAVVGRRIDWGTQPPVQRTRPFATLTLVSEPETMTLDGPSGVRAALVQVDVWADTYAAAEAGAQAVRGLLAGYRGLSGGVTFCGVFPEGHRDLSNESEVGVIYGLSSDFRVIWSE